LTRIYPLGYIQSMDTMTLSALAEPNRLRIVEMLRDKPSSVGDIAKRLVMRQPQVSKHLRVLNEAGLVAVRPMAQQRIYQLQAEPFEELDGWLETFRRLWEKRLDVMEEVLKEVQRDQARKSKARKK
jgi:DNA-binding transcriptional ArsR family regulator